MKTLLTTALLLLCTLCGFSQQNFLINEGSAGVDDEFYYVAETTDGNFVAVGYTAITDPDWDMLICKVDINGVRLWTKTIGTPAYDEAFGIIATSDGGFAVSGALNEQMSILKFDASGNLQWNKQYTDMEGTDGSRLLQTSDGGFLLPGFVDVQAGGNKRQSYLVKTDAAGNVQWSKKYFSPDVESVIYDIKRLVDGNYAFLSTNFGSNDTACVVKINGSGDVLWARYFLDAASYTDGYSLVATPDGGCIISGTRGDDFADNGFIFKLNTAGTKLWSKTTNATDANLSLFTCVVGTNGGYAFMGSGTTADSNFYYLVKIDNFGNLNWTKAIRKDDNDIFGTYYTVINTSEGGYLVAGSALDASGQLDGTLLKFDVNFSNCKPSTGVFGNLVDYGTIVTATISAVPGNAVVSTSAPAVSATSINTLVCTALPLNLTSFTAFYQNKVVQLKWQTAQEINTAYFDIEKSRDGRTFTAFEQVPAAGFSNGPLGYTTSDNAPYPAKSWYRLKMVDKDGQYTYSNMVAVTSTPVNGISINPNPVGNTLNLHVQQTTSSKAYITITDVNGKLLLQQQTLVSNGSNLVAIDVSGFAKGMYFIRINQDNASQTLKWLKQ